MVAEAIKKRSDIMSFIQKKITVIYIVIMSLLIFLRDVVDISLNKYVFVALCVMFFVISSKENIIYMLMFTFPLLCGLPGNYIMPVAILLYFIKSKNIGRKQLFFCIFIALMELLASLFYNSIDFPEIVGYITTLMFFFCLIYDKERYDYKKCIYYFVLGVTLTCAVIVIATISRTPSWQNAIVSGNFRFGEIEHKTDLNLTLNANSLAFISIAGISCCTVLLRCSSFNKIFLTAEIAVLAVAGLLTLSRTWVLVLAMFALLYILSTDLSLKGILRTFIGCGIFIFIGYFVFQQFPEIFDGLIDRFERADFATGSGRYEITDEYMELFFKDLRTAIFGSGVTQYRSVMGAEESLHNSLVQILVCYGLIGTVIFALGWLSKPIRAIGKVKLLYWIPFLCVLVFSISLQIINPWYLIYPHLISIYAIQLGYERKSD